MIALIRQHTYITKKKITLLCKEIDLILWLKSILANYNDTISHLSF